MLDVTLDQTGPTRAAAACLAGAAHLHVSGTQRFENRLIRRNMDAAPASRQMDIKGDILSPHFRIHPEAFEMHRAERPVAGHVAYAVHQRAWSAAMDMRIEHRLL